MTYLELVNEVLKRLREDSISAIEGNTTGLLIGAFVNLAKDEVESAWNWTALRADLSITTVAGQPTAYITNSNARTRLLSPEDGHEAYNVTSKHALDRVPSGWLNRVRFLGSAASGPPTKFSVIGINPLDDTLQIRMYPTPNDSYTLTFPVVKPQDRLESSSTSLIIPWRPVVEKAYLYAIMERGEDAGQYSEMQHNVVKQALADAIGNDSHRLSDETVWIPR